MYTECVVCFKKMNRKQNTCSARCKRIKNCLASEKCRGKKIAKKWLERGNISNKGDVNSFNGEA